MAARYGFLLQSLVMTTTHRVITQTTDTITKVSFVVVVVVVVFIFLIVSCSDTDSCSNKEWNIPLFTN